MRAENKLFCPVGWLQHPEMFLRTHVFDQSLVIVSTRHSLREFSWLLAGRCFAPFSCLKPSWLLRHEITNQSLAPISWGRLTLLMNETNVAVVSLGGLCAWRPGKKSLSKVGDKWVTNALSCCIEILTMLTTSSEVFCNDKGTCKYEMTKLDLLSPPE